MMLMVPLAGAAIPAAVELRQLGVDQAGATRHLVALGHGLQLLDATWFVRHLQRLLAIEDCCCMTS